LTGTNKDTVPTNKELHDELSQYVARRFLPDYGGSSSRIVCSPLEVNCFSICFSLDVCDVDGQRGIYVKIPKMILYRKDKEHIMPLADADRQLAKDEYRSLTHLSLHWRCDDMDVRFVKPLGFLADYNAIITERIYARHFFKVLRRCDLGLIRKGADPASNVMTRLGKALATFHNTSLTECRFDMEPVVAKMIVCCRDLKSYGGAPGFVDQTMSRLRTLRDFRASTGRTNTLKGFDVRQVFIDDDDAVYLLDPGKMTLDYQDVDVARFIVTCRILYWGSMFFFMRTRPDTSYEGSFRRSYYGRSEERAERVLSLLIVKELLKHWRMAYVVMEAKGWPSPTRGLLGKTYIDPFYKAQIGAELSVLER